MSESTGKRAYKSPSSSVGSSAGSVNEFLSFRLGGEEYGIDILKVQEIRGYEQPTRMVNAPPFVLGVLNLRGLIVPILDMRLKFGMGHAGFDSQTVTIVLNISGRVVGMVVDAVSDVVALKSGEIKPAPEFSGAIESSRVIGIATLTQGDVERMLILLDIEKLMASPDTGFAEHPAEVEAECP